MHSHKVRVSSIILPPLIELSILPPFPPPVSAPPPFCAFSNGNKCYRELHVYCIAINGVSRWRVSARCFEHYNKKKIMCPCVMCGENQAQREDKTYYACCCKKKCIQHFKEIQNEYIVDCVANMELSVRVYEEIVAKKEGSI